MEVTSRNGLPGRGIARIGTIARYALSHRFAMIAIAAALLAAGLWSSWGWLTALGLAPLVLALLPCAVMCALGLCMRHGDGASHAHQNGATTSALQSVSAPAADVAAAAPERAPAMSGPASKRHRCC